MLNSEEPLDQIMAPFHRPGGCRYHPGLLDLNESIQRKQVLARLWRERNERDVTPKLLQFLDDPVYWLGEHAAKVLGVLECPEAEEPLEEILRQWEHASSQLDLLSPMVLQMALGHIRSRHLTGRAKLDRIVQEFDLDYEGAAIIAGNLTRLLHATDATQRQLGVRSRAYPFVLEIVNTLCALRRRGESLDGLGAERFAIGPNVLLRLQWAALPPEDEARRWLDHATTAIGPTGEIFAPLVLLDCGPHAVDLLLERLKDIRARPSHYGISQEDAPYLGLRPLFSAASLSGDERALPLLQSFETITNLEVRGDAMSAYETALQGHVALLPP